MEILPMVLIVFSGGNADLIGNMRDERWDPSCQNSFAKLSPDICD
jgi:hypothetical protein